jgi:hypothetical protein
VRRCGRGRPEAFFPDLGVSDRDLDQMSQFIDGSKLKGPRAKFIDRNTPGVSR